ncbi:MAG: SPOR domain-containing protein [Candidatus Methylopumilus sp.]|jgi:DedD protein
MPPENSQAQLNDQEIQFKKRARRRLVGAIALVLIMVAVLPMVLDDHVSKTPQQEIAISIPSQENSDFTSKIVPVAPAAGQEPIVEVPAELPPVPIANPEPAQKAVEKPAKPVTAESLPKTVEPVAKSQPAKTEAPKPKKEAAARLVDDKKVAEAATGPVYVQIGVFSDAANVKQLQQKLSALSLKSYTEKIDTPKGEKTRLRAGPFASRQDAESALVKLKDVGLNGMIVSK